MKGVVPSKSNSAFWTLEPVVAFFSTLILRENVVPDDTTVTQVWQKIKYGCNELPYTHRLPIDDEDNGGFDIAMAQLVAMQHDFFLQFGEEITLRNKRYLPYTVVKLMRMNIEEICALRKPWNLATFMHPKYRAWLPLLYQLGPMTLTATGVEKFRCDLPLKPSDFVHIPPPELVRRVINKSREVTPEPAETAQPEPPRGFWAQMATLWRRIKAPRLSRDQ